MSLYDGKPPEQWRKITEKLVKQHPLGPDLLLQSVANAWKLIQNGKIFGYQLGKDIIPNPQIIGFFLHELIPLEVTKLAGPDWRREKEKHEKDVVCISNPKYSFEIKTSSNKSKIFGNRSYGQVTSGKAKKVDKSGYFMAVNFEKFSSSEKALPELYRVRFGWLDATDWRSQSASTGQQASLSTEVEVNKLLILWQR